jgi:putative transcriptional regulator
MDLLLPLCGHRVPGRGASSAHGLLLGKKGVDIVTIVRKSKSQIRKCRVDHAKLRSATEEQIAAWKREDGIDDAHLGSPRYVPNVDVRTVREHLGLSQEDFAARFRLSLRTIQEWEQGRKQPSEAARVLLFAIAREPKALERALRPV